MHPPTDARGLISRRRFLHAAVAGVLTATVGLHQKARPRPGETVFLSGNDLRTHQTRHYVCFSRCA